MPQPLFAIRVKKQGEQRIQGGCPWLSAGEIVTSSEALTYASGALVDITTARGEWLGVGTYHPDAPISCRILSRKREAIDEAWFFHRIQAALARREKHFTEPYYRLIHAEADGLPGVIADRFGDALVLQLSTAGMERLRVPLLDAIDAAPAPALLILRNDIPARALEGLPQRVEMVRGVPPPLIEVRENGCRYLADLMRGQKTGWFYDQRDNRALMAQMSEGKRVLDVYSHSGGFGLLAARCGATEVTMLDSSVLALELAQKAAALNGVEARCAFMQGDAFAEMERLGKEGKRFDVVIADPPPFVKSRKDLAAGLKGYAKAARLAATLVAPGGVLFVASCSHHALPKLFEKAVLEGIAKAGRTGSVLHRTGHAPDHPIHPRLPQSAYLKAVVIKMSG